MPVHSDNSTELMEKLVRNIEKYRVVQESWTQNIALHIVQYFFLINILTTNMIID